MVHAALSEPLFSVTCTWDDVEAVLAFNGAAMRSTRASLQARHGSMHGAVAGPFLSPSLGSASAPRQSEEQVGNGPGLPLRSGDLFHAANRAEDRSNAGVQGPALDGGRAVCSVASLGVLALDPDADGAGAALAPGAAVLGGARYRARSVAHCAASTWTFGAVSKRTGDVQFWPFRCKSWRCARCAPAVNRRDYARIEAALGGVQLADCLFVTLTFDPAKWRDMHAAWSAAGSCWKDLRDALAYEYGVGAGRGRRKATIVYVQTWEQHKSGWPHVHALVHCPAIARDVRRLGSYAGKDARSGEERLFWRWGSKVLRPRAVSAGFGHVVDVQFPRKESEALAGYLVKIAAELTGSHAKDQRPVEAPRGFRRLRATPKFLAPIAKASGEWAGAMIAAPIEHVQEAFDRGAELWDSLENAAKTLWDQPWRRRSPALSAASP